MKKLSAAKEKPSSKIGDLVKRAISKTVQREMEEWPPGCYSALYQPKRPPLPDRLPQQTK